MAAEFQKSDLLLGTKDKLESVTGRVSSITEKKEDIWLGPMTEAVIPTEMSKEQHDNTKTSPKSSITLRLRTDLGRSAGVTTVIQLVWLTGLRA